MTDLHLIGSVFIMDATKKSLEQSRTGGRGEGCQLALSNIKLMLDGHDLGPATGRVYGESEIVVSYAALKSFSVKACFEFSFRKIDGAWKMISMKFAPFLNPAVLRTGHKSNL
ncbi:unnamed protein product [Rhizoctonia solani]|uniref:SnoaL-like domain-containing protein n=1 Tax=Rhizoctonia solani TaxID=456999 RepID=A0A8H3CWE4_9AGAM|nr:unnamed protein product [Rhizoctonia solani]